MEKIIVSVLVKMAAQLTQRFLKFMAKKKRSTNQVNFRIDDDTRDKLQSAAEANTAGDTSVILRACIEAYIEAFERDGEITTPLAIISKKKLRALESPTGAASPPFPSTARSHDDVHLLNESTPTPPALAPRANSPAATKSRRALRAMTAKEKPNS